jgi:hypothetical protein
MNASDVIKARRNKVLFQAYYRPTIFPNNTVSTTNFCPFSSIDGGATTYTSSVNTIYKYKCEKPFLTYDNTYEMINDVNSGKYGCGYPYCSTLSIWQTGETIPVGTCNCKISNLQWKNTNSTVIYNMSTANYSSVITTSTVIMTGPGPVICPLINYYQGTNFDNQCGDSNNCCSNCD